MKISFYKSLFDTTPINNKEYSFHLDRIKKGDVKEIIEEIRNTTDKETRDRIKKKLTGVNWQGIFSQRSINGLKKHSGLCILDFDGHNKPDELKEQILSDKFTHAVWFSPSGNGVKVLVKIPFVDNNEDYGCYVEAIYDHYDLDEYADRGTKDISRHCYDSYDPEIYINLESETFTDRNEIKPLDIGVLTNIPLLNQDDIADKLLIWFKGRWTGNNRNTNLFVFARALNSFGVSKDIALRYLLQFEMQDFKAREIKSLCDSAYKNTSEFGTKQFEDNTVKRKIHKLLQAGEDKRKISKRFKDLDPEKLEKEIEIQEQEIDKEEFWYYSNDSLKLAPRRFKTFLENHKFFKFYPSGNEDKSFIFISKEDNFISPIIPTKIKDYVLEKLDDRGDFDAWDLCAASTRTFSPEFLSMLETADIDISRDTRETGIIYYKNKAVKVHKDKFELINYDDIDGFVWKDQVIDREVKLQAESQGEYQRFIWLISGKDPDRYYAFKSVIGYLLHSFKDKSKNRAIIFNDEMISENPNGGSGKGIFHYALSMLKKVSRIDGKLFDNSKSFIFQTVDPDSQILLFDDVKKGFDFESLFSVITEGITIEKKGKDAMVLSFEDSPKISITTNYTIKGSGGSHERRKYEIEMSSYFNSNHTPYDEFGHSLFDDWNSDEWEKFDNFMLRCLQYYLNNGLVEVSTKNLEIRKVMNETSQQFFEFMESQVFDGERIPMKEFYNKFVEEYEDYKTQKWFTRQLFTKWRMIYSEYKGFKYDTGSSNGVRWFSITPDSIEPKKEVEADDDIPF